MLDFKNVILILIVAMPFKSLAADNTAAVDLEAGQLSGIEFDDDEDLMSMPEIKKPQTPRVDKTDSKPQPPQKLYTPKISGRDIANACEKAIVKLRGGLATRGSGYCYRGVKFCLKNAGLYDKSYLNDYVGSSFTGGDGTRCTAERQMESAKCAHQPLINIGMKKLDIKSAKDAPMGSVLVYGGGPHGHIEVVGQDSNGQKKYYSDFVTSRPISDYNSDRKLIGVYAP